LQLTLSGAHMSGPGTIQQLEKAAAAGAGYHLRCH
jgi:hypothetical protein